MENEDRSAAVAVLHDLVKQVQELESLVNAYRSEMEHKASEEDRRARERAAWFDPLYRDDKYMRIATRKEDRHKAEKLEKELNEDRRVRAFRRSHRMPEGGLPSRDDRVSWFREIGSPDALSYEEGIIWWMGRDGRSGTKALFLWVPVIAEVAKQYPSAWTHIRTLELGHWGEDLYFNPNSFHFQAHCFEEELDEFVEYLLELYGLRVRWHSPLRVCVVTGSLDAPPTNIPKKRYAWLPEFVKQYGGKLGIDAISSGLPGEKIKEIVDKTPRGDKTEEEWQAAVSCALYLEGEREGCLGDETEILSHEKSVYKIRDREMVRRVRLWYERGIDWTVLEWKEGSGDGG